MLLQLFMVEEAKVEFRKSATYVGEVKIKWKHCLDDDKMNDWQFQQVALTDPENKAPSTGGILSCQINIQVRYQETSKIPPKKPRYGAL